VLSSSCGSVVAHAVYVLAACAVAFAFGYVGSVPLAGPIAVLVLSRAARGKFGEALRIGAGAAVAEGLYAGASFWSFAALVHRSALLVPIARGATALVLLPLGLYFVFWRSTDKRRVERHESRVGTALLGFTISALNPTLFITWSAAVGLSFSRQAWPMSEGDAFPFGLSAAAGVVLWFLTLVLLLRRYESKLRGDVLSWIVRGLGVTLFFIGVWSAFVLARSLARTHTRPLTEMPTEWRSSVSIATGRAID
jgi:threonine/homoserine/homoserine lactone efflux protein